MASPLRVVVEQNVEVPMRDGTVLRADLYRPESGGPYPALLQRTPYNKALFTTGLVVDPVRVASRGYAVVIQDTRGRYASDGRFYVFRDEAQDGFDTVEWVASQPWCDGKVGMFGASYHGVTQWQAAVTAPPHLKTIAPWITGSDYHEGWTYQGGAFCLGFNLSWTLAHLAPDTLLRDRERHESFAARWDRLVSCIDGMTDAFRRLPLTDLPEIEGLAPYYFDWLAHPDDDAYWRQWNVEDRWGDVVVPAFHLGGWYDIFLGGTLRNFVGMQRRGGSEVARRGQKLIVGPWGHGLQLANPVGEVDFGLRSTRLAIDLDGLMLRWYDRWLKGEENGVDREPPVKLFVMGENVWRDETEWPLSRAVPTPFYLHSKGGANSLHGDGWLSPEPPGHEPVDTYLADPRRPVPTRGGGLCCYASLLPLGAYDQRCVERRPDVLVYTSPPLDEDVEVTGPISAVLYASSSAPDTDFTVKLVDVDPSGYARNLTDGILRARYREGTRAGRLIEPGRVYEYTIDVGATSNLFRAGHRIRIEIASSNFPRFDRNPQTGVPAAEARAFAPAVQTVYHEPAYPSRVILPIVPRR
ncbi:MAG TPA: CocE/NonD family hydrolase [Chloroflexota bacterium]